MGVYHQGGVIPTQVFLSTHPDATNAIWWKTYSPPIWLLNGKNEVLKTHDLMGTPLPSLLSTLESLATCHLPFSKNETQYLGEREGTYLVAPLSAVKLDELLVNRDERGLRFREVWRYRRHLNLDDLDLGEEGVRGTWERVVGRRGIGVWRVTRFCG